MVEHRSMRLGEVLRWVGPGLLMAGAAIGVSHLMQATRAGAGFGFQLLGLVVVVNLLKYPFFEFGHRYAAATGESLLEGYLQLGRGFLWLFLGFNVVSAVISTAGVTFLTAGLSAALFGGGLGPLAWSVILLAVCSLIIVVGRFDWLDGLMKVIMAVLVLATLAALAMALARPAGSGSEIGPSAWSWVNLGFLLALMGWMPAPVEVSVWQSLWVEAKARGKTRVPLRAALADFNLGYGLTTVLALAFLALGALMMHGSGLTFERSNLAFARQLIDVYQRSLGGWSGPVVSTAAFTAMFSTTLTVFDAFPRSLARATALIRRRGTEHRGSILAWSVFVAGGAVTIIGVFAARFTALIDFVTMLAFLTAPVFAGLNLALIRSRHTPPAARPPAFLVGLAIAGLVFFLGFAGLYAVSRIAPGMPS
jgi:Mn2+/Fe2+ NRAMP family transporter